MLIDTDIVDVEMEAVLTLPREGIVIARYLVRPRQGFALRAASTLGGCAIASLTAAHATHADGSRRRDLVGFRLADRRDAGTIAPGQALVLRGVEAAGFFRD